MADEDCAEAARHDAANRIEKNFDVVSRQKCRGLIENEDAPLTVCRLVERPRDGDLCPFHGTQSLDQCVGIEVKADAFQSLRNAFAFALPVDSAKAARRIPPYPHVLKDGASRREGQILMHEDQTQGACTGGVQGKVHSLPGNPTFGSWIGTVEPRKNFYKR